jgi:hypothetical protein
MVRETKRNGTKKILNIKKRNETKRYHLGNGTKRNDQKNNVFQPLPQSIMLSLYFLLHINVQKVQ